MKPFKLAPLCGVLLLALASCGCNKLKARDQLNKGVAAFRNAQFQTAIDHFQRAVALDPTLTAAKLYLATAMRQLYIPSGDSPENVKVGKDAIQAFEDVLKEDPNNATALATIAQTYYEMRDFDKAKEYQRKRLEADPNNPEPYYWIGVIDWAVAQRENSRVRTDLKLNVPNPDGDFPPLPAKARDELSQKNGAIVDEGVKSLQKDLEMKPNDADAMAYLNLLLRQKADLEAESSARASDLKQATALMEKSIATRKEMGEKSGK
ncbi:MAG TPA: tetratricopeptide repeat protein [Terriglobia bacterium]|nr:tetratricopeptide repeat protein [Terriglobia bacterium]